MNVIRSGYRAIIVTRDNRLAEHFESALSTTVSTIRVITEDMFMDETLDTQTLVFLDARGSQKDASGLVSRLMQRRKDAKVFVVSNEKSAELVLVSMRAGAVDYLSFPVSSTEVIQSVCRIVERDGRSGTEGQIIAMFSLKGGQGITSLATNLVDHLFLLTRAKCLLADLNLYMGHASVGLDMKCSYTPFDLIRDLERADDNLLFSSLEQHDRGFYILGVSEQIADATQIAGDDIGNMLHLLRQYVRYTVLDLPHDLSGQVLAGLDAADRIMLVVQQDIPSLKSAQLALQVFSDLDYDTDKIAIVVNRYLDRNEIELQDIEHSLKRSVFATVSNDYRTIAEIYNKGQTVDTAAKESRLNTELAQLAGLLTGMSPRIKKRWTWRDLLPV